MSQAAPLPFSAAEEELRQIKLSEVHTTHLGQQKHLGHLDLKQ